MRKARKMNMVAAITHSNTFPRKIQTASKRVTRLIELRRNFFSALTRLNQTDQRPICKLNPIRYILWYLKRAPAKEARGKKKEEEKDRDRGRKNTHKNFLLQS